jgi:phosphomannomutase
VGDDAVVAVRDYEQRTRRVLATGETSRLTLPASNVMAFELASGSRIIARPSGTEPKAKFYFDVREDVRPGEDVAAAKGRAVARMRGLEKEFGKYAGE